MLLFLDGAALGSKAHGSEADLGGGGCRSWRRRQSCSHQRSDPLARMALGGSVALAAVGPLVINRAMPAVVVSGDRIVFQRRSN